MLNLVVIIAALLSTGTALAQSQQRAVLPAFEDQLYMIGRAQEEEIKDLRKQVEDLKRQIEELKSQVTRSGEPK